MAAPSCILMKIRELLTIKCRPIRYCCAKNSTTVAATVACEIESSQFRTLESNPLKHTHHHGSKFYTISPKTYKKLFTLGGFSKSVESQFKTFRENCVMIRNPALQLINYLNTANYSLPAIRYIIYGRVGTGKSLTLAHVIHYASEKNWLLLHIPWALNWTYNPKDFTSSVNHPGQIDLPIDSALWLQHFHTQNSTVLQELDLRLSRTYEWSKREITNEGEPLTALIDKGINRMKFASECIKALLQEIKLHSQSERFNAKNIRILVAVDGVNCFFKPTKLKRDDKSVVQPSDVTPIRAFMNLFNNDWKNAAIVVTVDSMAIPFMKSDIYTPHALLGKEGFNCFEPFVPVLVDNYTEKEINNCIDYYIDRMWIQNKNGHTEIGRKELKFLSGHNPYSLMQICAPL